MRWLALALLPACFEAGTLKRICPRECYSGPADSRGLGVCKPGKPRCDADNLGVVECVGEVVPSEEICDGLDNDCDGRTDEGFGSRLTVWFDADTNPCPSMYGECAKAIVVCDGGWRCDLPDTYEPVETRCDGLDNDCDAAVDEDLFLGQHCYTGPVGSERFPPCHAGAMACVDGQVCCVNEGLPTAELACDGIDQDCNGMIDDSPSQDPVDVVLVIDNSGSMWDDMGKVLAAWDSVAALFGSNPMFQFAAVLATGHNPVIQVIHDFTDARTLQGYLIPLGTGGNGTEPTLDAIDQVCDPINPLALSWRDESIRRVWVFSDEWPQTHTGLQAWDINCPYPVDVWTEYTDLFAPVGTAHSIWVEPEEIRDELISQLGDLCQ